MESLFLLVVTVHIPECCHFSMCPKNISGVIFTVNDVLPMKLPTFISCNFLKYDFPQYYSKKISPDIEIFNKFLLYFRNLKYTLCLGFVVSNDKTEFLSQFPLYIVTLFWRCIMISFSSFDYQKSNCSNSAHSQDRSVFRVHP